MLIRQLRGALGITLLWGLMWLPLGVGFGLWRYLTIRCREFVEIHCYAGSAWSAISPNVWLWTAWGAINGFLFAAMLSVLESRRSVSQLSVLRLAVWGAVGAMPLPSVLAIVVSREQGWTWWLLVPFVIAITVGSICAALTAGVAIRGAKGVTSERAA